MASAEERVNIEELRGRLVAAYGLLLNMETAMSAASDDEADVRAVGAIAEIVLDVAEELTPIVEATGGFLEYRKDDAGY